MPDTKDLSMDRRRFLKTSGMLGVGAAALAAMPLSEAIAFDKNLSKVTRNDTAMGTFVSITVLHPSKAAADDAIEAAFAEMKRVASLLDRHNPSSPIGALNARGRAKGLPEEAVEVLSASLLYNQVSGGAFDPTVAPVVDLYKNSFNKNGLPPTKKEMSSAMGLVDAKGLLLHGSSATLAKPGMAVTLDGIAKGYVIDAGALALKKRGVRYGLVNAGGDIHAIGGKGEGKSWTVAVRNPAGAEFLDKISMKNGAVATSGNYEVYFDREKLFHHIVNPNTGTSPVASASVTVRSDTVMAADALSTAVFVMGPRRGKEFINNTPGTACLILSRGGKKTASANWKQA